MYLFQVIVTLFCSAQILTAYRFHEQLSPEERLHYFGTQLIDEVPEYHFTSPEPIQRRRRSTDDRTEYIVDLFGEATHLLLDKNTDLIAPGCVVQHLGANGTRTIYPCSNQIDCFYTGRTSNHSDSWVSASVCGGLHGVIGTVESTFLVQPIRREHSHRLRRDTSVSGTHIVSVYRNKRSCDDDKKGKALHNKRKAFRNRKKRTPARRTIETSVVVEPEVVKFHGNGTELFVKTVMNVAAGRFLDSSLKNKLYMTLNKLVILEDSQAGLTLDEDSTVTLDSFCEWQSTWNEKDDKNPSHADYVLLLTKLDLKHNGNTANSGLARKGMCGEKTKCSINEDIGLGSGFIIAHETGHVLGMSHDGSGNACANDKNIMSSLAASGPDSFKWSQCSADALKRALGTIELNCLDDRPPGSAEKSYVTKKKPGTIYTANQQCRLMLGPTAEVCDTHADGQDVCGSIVCRAKPDTGVNGCVIYSAPRMDGTDCGNRHWCIGGRCVAMTRRDPGKMNGGWSSWDLLSACSRTCGGGVRVKRRYCNNPEPQYGGNPCSGSDSMAEMCNVQACSTSQEQFKADQCAATDGEPIQGQSYHWVPNTGALGDDSCEKSCQAAGTNWFAKRGINIDGTECISDQISTFSRCVTGKCKIFGCDGHMDSGKSFDQCGVCDGAGNTCTKASGTFKAGKARAFTTFVTMPIGSTGITITQGNGYCFLNVKVDDNNLFSASAPRSSGSYVVGGVNVKYNKNPERINIIGPTKSYIQAQVYRQYGPPYVGVDPDVYYEYHTPKSGISSSTYMWKTQAGTCSKQCGTGSQVPVVTCVNANSGTVDNKFCNLFDKPKEDAKSCNTHACPPRWQTGNWNPCSKTCGGGNKHRIVECVEENRNVETVLLASRCHGIAKPAETAQCNTDACPGGWRAGAWSACSETCSRGTRTRDVKCYASSTSSTVVSDSVCSGSAKPETTEYCVVKPCRTDLTGSNCVDKVADCFKNYGDGVCNGQYKGWASTNCMKSCAICSDNPAASDPNCKDKLSNCASYQPGFCTDSSYKAWAANNCKRHCGLCGSQPTTTTTTTAPLSNSNCKDKKDNCADYGADVCTKYADWAKDNCKAFCKKCELTTQSSIQQAACQDKVTNCAQYQANMCTDYGPWAKANCKAFCHLCGTRRKRDVSEEAIIAPPVPQNAPPLIVEPPLATLKLIEDEILVKKREPMDDSDDNIDLTEDEIPRLSDLDTATKKLKFLEPDVVVEQNEPIDDSIDETESLEKDLDDAAEDIAGDVSVTEDVELNAPDMPVCNTVLTSPSGRVDVTGKLAPGVLCEQTIALPLDSRVSVEFTNLDNVDCDSGDTLTVTDVMTDDVTDLCVTPLNQVWLSTGSIVAIAFTSSVEGHRFSFAYQSLTKNKSVSGCSQHLTAVSGIVEPMKVPQNYMTTYDTCEIYITGTPGKNVQLEFMKFIMSGDKDNCADGEGMIIENLVDGEVDEFCGEHQPFIWESHGSRIRIVYSPLDNETGFTAKYSIQDI